MANSWMDSGSVSYTNPQGSTPSGAIKPPHVSPQVPKIPGSSGSPAGTPPNPGTSVTSPKPTTPAKPPSVVPTHGWNPSSVQQVAEGVGQGIMGGMDRYYQLQGNWNLGHAAASTASNVGNLAARLIPGVGTAGKYLGGAISGLASKLPYAAQIGQAAGVGHGMASKLLGARFAPLHVAYTAADMARTGYRRAMGTESGAEDYNNAIASLNDPNTPYWRNYLVQGLENTFVRPGRSIINFAETAPGVIMNSKNTLDQYVRGNVLDFVNNLHQQQRQNATAEAMANGTATKQQLADATTAARREGKDIVQSRWYRPWLWGADNHNIQSNWYRPWLWGM